jgi:hypothetical protein
MGYKRVLHFVLMKEDENIKKYNNTKLTIEINLNIVTKCNVWQRTHHLFSW